MIVSKFWARGYRSLDDVTLDNLGSYVVFYGPNGSGKSNLLDALQSLFCLMPLAVETAYGPADERLSFREAGNRSAEWIDSDDFHGRKEGQKIILGAIIRDPFSHFGGMRFHEVPIQEISVELSVSHDNLGRHLQFTKLYIDKRAPGLPFTDSVVRDILQWIVPQAFTNLGVTRTLSVTIGDHAAADSRSVSSIPDGQVVRELFQAKNARDRTLRARFDMVKDFMEKTLHRGAFDVFMDTATGRLELREMLPEPNPLKLDIRVDLAGHGVVQMYSIVTSILLAGGQLVAIEEPEAHLHAPTLGRELRAILRSMVLENRIHQLFIATHSNLFDLDPNGYWDVSLVNGETKIERKPLSEIDAHHLYEPGPAKHALLQILRYAPSSKVVFRRPEGTPISAQEMLDLLQQDDEIALGFLRNLHGAALRIVRLDARRKGEPA